MRARLAKVADMSEIVALGARLMPQTNYGTMAYNAVTARRSLKAYMTNGDSRVWVSEDAHGRIRGVLIGEVGPMGWSTYVGATDFVFAAEAGGDKLLEAYVAWCKLRGVARIDMGISAGTLTPRQEKALLRAMRRHGFVYSGMMFHRDLLAEAKAAKGEAA
jgi:hypothetical protein